jgi:PIN domain nuclease of toxin-antitoxin system
VALYVADTHALIWHALGRTRKLGRKARATFERAERGTAAIYVPTIVLVELLEAAQRGVIRLSLPTREWVRGLFSSAGFLPADLTTDVVLAANDLSQIPERGDRLIAATAASLKLPLLTRDESLSTAGIEVVW